jgi:hypothetical protein
LAARAGSGMPGEENGAPRPGVIRPLAFFIRRDLMSVAVGHWTSSCANREVNPMTFHNYLPRRELLSGMAVALFLFRLGDLSKGPRGGVELALVLATMNHVGP